MEPEGVNKLETDELVRLSRGNAEATITVLGEPLTGSVKAPIGEELGPMLAKRLVLKEITVLLKGQPSPTSTAAEPLSALGCVVNGRGEMVDFRRVRRPPRPPPPAAARGRAPGCAPAVAAGDQQPVPAGTMLRVQQAPRLRSRLVAREQQFAALGDGAWRNESRGRVRRLWRSSHRVWWQ